MRPRPSAVAARRLAVTAVLLTGPALAQLQVFDRGVRPFDSRLNEGPFVQIAAGLHHGFALRSDGTVGAWGNGFACLQPLPAGTTCVQIDCGFGINGLQREFVLVLGSDGALRACGQSNAAAPPAGTFVEVAAGGGHALARRADGTVVAWGENTQGQCNVPPLPPGLRYTALGAGQYCSAALRSDGALLAWGHNDFGQCNVPPLPAGLAYVEVAMGRGDNSNGGAHVLARRSDGSVLAWGSNGAGQCNVPALPPGLEYVQVAAGRTHSVALRSDGAALAWGSNADGQCNVPALPAGLRYLEAAAGVTQTILRRDDGALRVAGVPGLVPVPPAAPAILDFVPAGYQTLALRADGSITDIETGSAVLTPPPGTTFTAIDVGTVNTITRTTRLVAVRSDGAVVDDGTVHAPPAGLAYVEADVSSGGSYDERLLLRRSDGTLEELFGGGPTLSPPPALPPGVTYVQADVGLWLDIALRSDGTVVVWNEFSTSGIFTIPPAPAGLRYVKVQGTSAAYALRSDGVIVRASNGQQSVLQPPSGLVYVDFWADQFWMVARLSDGSFEGQYPLVIPPLPAASAYEHVRLYGTRMAALISEHYRSVAPGCPGTLGIATLTAGAPPRLGSTMTLQIDRLPLSMVWLAFGFSRAQSSFGALPLELSFLGMPGCRLQVGDEAILPLVGSNHVVTHAVSIPNAPALAGLQFHNQALVFDPLANALGAVLSDAATGTVTN